MEGASSSFDIKTIETVVKGAVSSALKSLNESKLAGEKQKVHDDMEDFVEPPALKRSRTYVVYCTGWPAFKMVVSL